MVIEPEKNLLRNTGKLWGLLISQETEIDVVEVLKRLWFFVAIIEFFPFKPLYFLCPFKIKTGHL